MWLSHGLFAQLQMSHRDIEILIQLLDLMLQIKFRI